MILAESPSYVGALGTFLSYQAEVVHVPSDENGIDPVALRETAARLKAEGKRWADSSTPSPTTTTRPA